MAHHAHPASWLFSARADGDLAIDAADIDATRARLLAAAGGPGVAWNWLRQVHGADVVVADAPGQHQGTEADALVTARPGVPIAVQTADCAAVVLTSAEGVVGVAHAGWRGLAAGVLPATVSRMRSLGAGDVVAHVGPMIGPECYEFGAEDLATVVDVLGPEVRGRTSEGASALDVPRAIDTALSDAEVVLGEVTPGCTACDHDRWYSHRARRETARMAAVVWATP